MQYLLRFFQKNVPGLTGITGDNAPGLRLKRPGAWVFFMASRRPVLCGELFLEKYDSVWVNNTTVILKPNFPDNYAPTSLLL